MRVLHIVPHTFLADGYRFHGSTKDIFGRLQYFSERNLNVDQLSYNKTRSELRYILRDYLGRQYTCVLLDGSFKPIDVKSVRELFPTAFLITRSHNSELLHRKDYCIVANSLPQLLGRRDALRRNVLLFTEMDCAIARMSDGILAIEPLDIAARYWRHLDFRGLLFSSPYFLSDGYLNERSIGSNSVGRRDRVVCMTSAYPGALSYDLLRNFYAGVESLGETRSHWDFGVTGRPLEGFESASHRRVEDLGIVPDPLAVLRTSKAIAVLSDYGRGFKTKILDAIVCGAWVLVTPRLFKRLPRPVQPYCLLVDPTNRFSFGRALGRLEEGTAWPSGDPNSILRGECYAAMDSIFFRKAPS